MGDLQVITNKFLKLSKQTNLDSEKVIQIVTNMSKIIRRLPFYQVREALQSLMEILGNEDMNTEYHSVGNFVIIRLESLNTKYTITYSLSVSKFGDDPEYIHVALSAVDDRNVWGRTEVLDGRVKIHEEDIITKKTLVDGLRVKQTAKYYYGDDFTHTTLNVSFNGIEVAFSYL